MGNKTVQRLMENAPRGQALDSDMLRDFGVSPSLASHMVEQGWLRRLSRGAYLLKGDSPATDGTIAYLSRRVPGLHVGGKTALAWQGVRHNLAFRERVTLWGQKPYHFPAWVEQYMPFTYQTTNLFDGKLEYGRGLKPLPGGSQNVLVSVPERALLEMASDVGKTQSWEDASNLMSSLRSIRPHVLDDFLAHCDRVKVVRLVRDLGKEAGFSWAETTQKHVDRLGADKRWSNRTRLGNRLTLKPR